MGHTIRSMEDNDIENDLKFWELAQETSEKNFRILLENILAILW